MDSYHCVYPQVNSNVEALPLEWREEASRIIDNLRALLKRHPDHDGKYNGCCCGHTHRLLTESELSYLHNAGFVTSLESTVEFWDYAS